MTMKEHNRTEYRERPTLEGFLKIVQEIRLDGLSIFTFAVNALPRFSSGWGIPAFSKRFIAMFQIKMSANAQQPEK